MADRVYRARISEMWDLRDRDEGDSCEPIASWHEALGTAVSSLEVQQVWKGAVPAVLHSPMAPRYRQLGDIDTFFEAVAPQDGHTYSVVSNCGWDPAVDLGPPMIIHPYEPTPEEALWEAVDDDDPIAVAQALLSPLSLSETAHWEFQAGLRSSNFWGRQRFVPRCPPEAYDLLILSGARPLGVLETCAPERLLDMLPWILPDDPEWQSLLLHLDAEVLTALTTAGVQPDPTSLEALRGR